MRGTRQSQAKRERQRKLKIIILTAAALIAAVCAVWLLTAPSREREYVESAQDALIEEIMRDINGAEDMPEGIEGFSELPEIEETQRTEETTATDGDGVSDAGDYNGFEDITTDNEPEPEITPAYYPPVMSDPIPDNAFPANIIGIGILTIEAIDLRLPVAEGIDETTLRIAPGRVPQTAQVGDIGNAVIAGHRNYAYGSMFNRFEEIAIGDAVLYHARNGELMEFTVFEIAVIEPEDQIAFIQPLNESIITLYTCTPVREATHRLIIRAQRIS
jgi:sortase A